MIKKYAKEIKIIIVGIILLIIFVGIGIAFKDKERISKSIANDYNKEMEALIKEEWTCEFREGYDDLLIKINDFQNRYNNLSYSEKEYIDENLYKKLMDCRKSVVEKIEKIKDVPEVVLVFDAKVDNLDENISIEDNLKEIEDLVNEYKELPEGFDNQLLNYYKYKRIENKYYNYRAEIVEKMIDDIGEVEYTDECRGKLDAALEAYNNMDGTARYKVDNYVELVKKEAEYLKMMLEEKGKLYH